MAGGRGVHFILNTKMPRLAVINTRRKPLGE